MSHSRRWRCNEHPDYLLMPDDRCPWCKISKLEEEIETFRSREEMFRGEEVILGVNCSFNRLLDPIIRMLGYDNVRYPGNENDVVRIGSRGEHSSYYPVPVKVAEAIQKIAVEAETHLIDAVLYEVMGIQHAIESKIADAAREAIDMSVAEGATSRAASKQIVHEILHNDSTPIGWEDIEKIRTQARRAVLMIIEKHTKKEK